MRAMIMKLMPFMNQTMVWKQRRVKVTWVLLGFDSTYGKSWSWNPMQQMQNCKTA